MISVISHQRSSALCVRIASVVKDLLSKEAVSRSLSPLLCETRTVRSRSWRSSSLPLSQKARRFSCRNPKTIARDCAPRGTPPPTSLFLKCAQKQTVKMTATALSITKTNTNIHPQALLLVPPLWLAWVCWKLQFIACEDCRKENGACTLSDECDLFEKERLWSLLLIFTHIIPFVLVPLTMYIVWKRTPFLLENTTKKMDIFTLLLGLASICVAVSFEFCCHVSTAWYYRDIFHVDNFFFFFFLISSFALWANGFYSQKWVTVVFCVLIQVFVIMYPLGAATKSTSFKIPICVALTVIFFAVTMRGITVLRDLRMLWVPFFAVGVNLFFVALLKNADKDGPTKMNYVYHIAHDILGTEMGLAVFAYLVWDCPRHFAALKQRAGE